MAVTNNFENFQFDIFVFELDDEGNSKDFDCYKQAVKTKLFNTQCEWAASTKIYRNVDNQADNLKSWEESNDKDRIVVIDNTPFPDGGAFANATIVLEYAAASTYTMSYNLRSTSIYIGIISIVLSFAIGMLSYLTAKIKRDIKKKFEQDDEEESEEEQPDDNSMKEVE